MSAAGTVARQSPAEQAAEAESSDIGSDIEMVEEDGREVVNGDKGNSDDVLESISDDDSNPASKDGLKNDEDAVNLDESIELLDDESKSDGGIPNGQDEDDILRDDEDSFEDGGAKDKSSNEDVEEVDDDDDEVLYLDSDEEGDGSAAPRKKLNNDINSNSSKSSNSQLSGGAVENGRNPLSANAKNIDEDDVMEISEADPLGDCSEDKILDPSSPNTSSSANVIDSNDSKDDTATIVVNDTKSLVELANSKSESGKEPTLVIIDTNSILSGKGPVPVPRSASSIIGNLNKKHAEVPRVANSLHIPDDAFLIEAPSFIVPYVFEQAGEKTLKTVIKGLAAQVRKENEEKLAKGEELSEEDEIKESKKNTSEDYFDSPVGKLLMNVGMNLVQEYVQVDLLKMQKRKAEKEREKSRSNSMTMQTQQSIMSLKKNIEESKENNEPFRHPTKKCELCNFKTESELVMSTHLETPHMRNYSYRCNFCTYTTRVPQEILFHMEAEHNVKARLERAPAYHQCPNCAFEDNSKAKLTRHLQGCTKRFRIEKNLEPPLDWDTPAKLPKLPKNRLIPQGSSLYYATANQQQQQRNVAVIAAAAGAAGAYMPMQTKYMQMQSNKIGLPPLMQAPKAKPLPGLIRTNPKPNQPPVISQHLQRGLMMRGSPNMTMPQSHHIQMTNNQILQQVVNSQMAVGAQGAVGGFLSKLGLLQSAMNAQQTPIQKSASQQIRPQPKPTSQPSISITPLPRNSSSPSSSVSAAAAHSKPPPQGVPGAGGKTSFVICEICDGYIKDLDQLRNHMQWIHKVKIHPKMIYNKPPLNCQKCQFRFFTDQGLERHLLGSHGLVTSSMQDAANKGQDSGRCPLCGKVYQWKLLAHVAKDHSVTLKPAHLSYKCTVCTATFGMYKLFESHVYSAHSMNNKGRNDRRPQAPAAGNRPNQMQVTSRPIVNNSNQNSFKPLKINDEITIIPQPLANSSSQPRNKGSLTITPQSASRRSMRGNDDDGIQIIEIDDAPQKSNGRRENGEFKGRLPISDSTLRKRNLEISVCGTDSDNNSSDESYLKGPSMKRLRNN